MVKTRKTGCKLQNVVVFGSKTGRKQGKEMRFLSRFFAISTDDIGCNEKNDF
ncbi:MAG: hypothetical protein ACYDG2_00960 [Ruminiclostridium sp.]